MEDTILTFSQYLETNYSIHPDTDSTPINETISETECSNDSADGSIIYSNNSAYGSIVLPELTSYELSQRIKSLLSGESRWLSSNDRKISPFLQSFDSLLPIHQPIQKPVKKPSKFFCKTGCLDQYERYDQDLHNAGINTIRSRATGFYTEEEIQEMEKDFHIKKPSLFYCKTGVLDIEMGEQYDQNIHFYSKTIRGRSQGFYSEEDIQKMEKNTIVKKIDHK
jgi:hypothetical protein